MTANLPPIISFSSAEEPELEIRITLENSQPIIVALKRSRLWPLNLQSALTLHYASSGRQEYLPRVDTWRSYPPLPRLTPEHKDEFLGLRPGETSIVRVSFRPHDEPYDYEKLKDKGMERYRMLFPIGMQFLKAGEEYEIGVQQVQPEGYMIGDLEEIMSEDGEGSVWKQADGVLEVIPGEGCRFRVEA